MSTSSRSAILTKCHKVLKKHYQPVLPAADRSVLEHLLYACCLENARYEDADASYGRLIESYFDWNEIRVTTIAELAEVLADLPDPADAAQRLRSTLQSVFESHYSFDLEHLRKENIGAAAKKLAEYKGVDEFCTAYATQHALGGHAIPTDNATIFTLLVLGAATEAEAKSRQVPGLERAIPKAKGPEFASLLHQFSAELAAAPQTAKLRAIATEISPDAKDRLPQARKNEAGAEPAAKSRTKKKSGERKAPPQKAAAGTGKTAKKKTSAAGGKKSSADRLARKKPR